MKKTRFVLGRVKSKLWIIFESLSVERFTRKVGVLERLPNIHPGEILQKDFLEPMGITPYRLAKDLGITRTRVADILHTRRDITPDTAIRLGLYFGIEPEFWLNLQAHYNLVETRLAHAENYQAIQPHRHFEAV